MILQFLTAAQLALTNFEYHGRKDDVCEIQYQIQPSALCRTGSGIKVNDDDGAAYLALLAAACQNPYTVTFSPEAIPAIDQTLDLLLTAMGEYDQTSKRVEAIERLHANKKIWNAGDKTPQAFNRLFGSWIKKFSCTFGYAPWIDNRENDQITLNDKPLGIFEGDQQLARIEDPTLIGIIRTQPIMQPFNHQGFQRLVTELQGEAAKQNRNVVLNNVDILRVLLALTQLPDPRNPLREQLFERFGLEMDPASIVEFFNQCLRDVPSLTNYTACVLTSAFSETPLASQITTCLEESGVRAFLVTETLEKMAEIINKDAAMHTNSLITQCITPQDLDRVTIALYSVSRFNFMWTNKFTDEMTTTFYSQDGKNSCIQSIQGRQNCRYRQGENGNSLAIPTNFGHIVFNWDKTRKTIGEPYAPEQIREYPLQGLGVSIPRVEIESETDLLRAFSALDLLTNRNFIDTMGGTLEIFKQKACLKTDQKGGEGASATVAIAKMRGAPAGPRIDVYIDSAFTMTVVGPGPDYHALWSATVTDPRAFSFNRQWR